MGDWCHSTVGSGLGSAGRPPRVDVLQRAWFDKWLKESTTASIATAPRHCSSKAVRGPAHRASSAWYDLHPAVPDRNTQQDNGNRRVRRVYHPRPPTARAEAVVSPGLSTVCSRDAAQGTAGMKWHHRRMRQGRASLGGRGGNVHLGTCHNAYCGIGPGEPASEHEAADHRRILDRDPE